MTSQNHTREQFEALRQRAGALTDDELKDFFCTLQPVSVEDALGNWKGGYLKGMKIFFSDFFLLSWFGKRFPHANQAQAQIWKILGFKIGLAFGNSRLRMVEYQGESSLALLYNFMPIIDHFRKIDEHTLMGIMDIKGKSKVYFYLERV